MSRNSWLTSVYQRLIPRPARKSRRNSSLSTTAAVYHIERLESRVLLSASPAVAVCQFEQLNPRVLPSDTALGDELQVTPTTNATVNTTDTAHHEFAVGAGYTDSCAVATVNGPPQNIISALDEANIAPVLSSIESTFLPYFPGTFSAVITSTLTLSDPDSTEMTGATIQITENYRNGIDKLAFVNTSSITGVFDAASGTLTLTGSDTVAHYEAALRSVKYQSISLNPIARTVSFQVSDGLNLSNIESRSIGGELQLIGTVLNVFGTSDVDVITVTEAANLTINWNGTDHVISSDEVTAVNIFAGGGDDTIEIASLDGGTALIAYGEDGRDSITVSSSVTRTVTLDGGLGGDILTGGSGHDVLVGSHGNDILDGGDGEDVLMGNFGNDIYVFTDTSTNQFDTVVETVGQGTDLLDFAGLTSAVTVNLSSDTALATMLHRIVKTGAAGQAANFENVGGGSANDFITGNAAVNLLNGNGGNDTLNGGDGNDTLAGGDGNDLLKGGNQNDLLIGGIGSDYMKGEAGDDRLNAGDGQNFLAGGTGNDTYTFDAAMVNQTDIAQELAEEGTDTLDFASLGTAVTVILTSDAALAVMDHRIVQAGGTGQASNFENVIGGAGNDFLTGNTVSNVMSGNSGNDTLNGDDGDDTLDGGDGNDLLKGGNQNDVLIGGSGADYLKGEEGDDVLNGGDDQNILVGGTGNDTYTFDAATVNQTDTVQELAEEGTDTLNFASLVTTVTVNLASDNTLAVMAHRIVKTGAIGQAANFENANGGSGNDTLTGNSADNLLMGNGGNDVLVGVDGDDVLDGGNGEDVLMGNVGNDVYVFADTPTNQTDTVHELAAEGTDTLNFASVTTNVTVNLSSDTALARMPHRIVETGAAGQAENFENVNGGSGTDTLIGNAAGNLLMGNGGHDALVGGDGNDELHGGDGRNLLIGGLGGDLLLGGSDQDLLLSEKYNSETNALALQAMLVEWSQATPYQARIDHLGGTTPGGANGDYILGPSTVTDDGTADTLTGAGGQDWFLADSAVDVVTDRAIDEVFTHITHI